MISLPPFYFGLARFLHSESMLGTTTIPILVSRQSFTHMLISACPHQLIPACHNILFRLTESFDFSACCIFFFLTYFYISIYDLLRQFNLQLAVPIYSRLAYTILRRFIRVNFFPAISFHQVFSVCPLFPGIQTISTPTFSVRQFRPTLVPTVRIRD